jgi:hypothetical protein
VGDLPYNTKIIIAGIYILAPAIFHEEGKVASQMIYSNVRELVEHQQ